MTWRGAARGVFLSALLLRPGFGRGQASENHTDNRRNVRHETYDVDAASAADIRRELDRRGPMSAGKRYDARTEPRVRWWFDTERVRGGCRITNVRVDLEVVVTLPRWRRPTDADADLVARWRRYVQALEEHEAGHRAIWFAAADETLATLKDLSPAASCARAERGANRAGHDTFARYSRRDEEYDQETDHGATQGARFP